jgi:hypothetical protein
VGRRALALEQQQGLAAVARCLGKTHGVGELFERERPASGISMVPPATSSDRQRDRDVLAVGLAVCREGAVDDHLAAG